MGAEGTLKKVLRYRVLKKRKVWNETYLNYYYYYYKKAEAKAKLDYELILS